MNMQTIPARDFDIFVRSGKTEEVSPPGGLDTKQDIWIAKGEKFLPDSVLVLTTAGQAGYNWSCSVLLHPEYLQYDPPDRQSQARQ